MQKDKRLQYEAPLFEGAAVQLESGLCTASKNPEGTNVVRDNNVEGTINMQSGFSEDNKGIITVDSWD